MHRHEMDQRNIMERHATVSNLKWLTFLSRRSLDGFDDHLFCTLSSGVRVQPYTLGLTTSEWALTKLFP